MKDYEKMSDFEINMLVAKEESLIINEEQDAALKAKSSSVLVNVDGIISSFEFNPCNYPSDAWPIIVENKISISWVGTYWQVLPPLLSRASAVRDDNPLRAAMIVYLMIKVNEINKETPTPPNKPKAPPLRDMGR